MCFSATASFTTSSALLGAGITTAYLARNKTDRNLAVVPSLFGLHQAVEGVLWLGLRGLIDETLVVPFVYVYLFIAWVVWPVCIPLVFRTEIRYVL